jgi:hypothetical protein
MVVGNSTFGFVPFATIAVASFLNRGWIEQCKQPNDFGCGAPNYNLWSLEDKADESFTPLDKDNRPIIPCEGI